MKKNFIRLASIVAMTLMGLSACQNQNTKEIEPENGVYGYASFTIALPSNTLLAGVDGSNHGTEYIGTEAENKVTSVLIALYDNGVCAERFDLDITADGTNPFAGTDLADAANHTATKQAFTTKAQRMVKKEYQLVAFLNPTTEIKGRIAKGRALTDLTAFAPVKMDELVSTTNGIMMSNAKGISTLSVATFKTTANAAEKEPLAVNVDRGIAKVFVNPDLPKTPATGVLEGANLELKGWNLDVTNKKLFFIREMGLQITDPGTAPTDPEDASTPRIKSYAKDPNMTWTAGMENDNEEFTYLGSIELKDTDNTLWKAGYNDADGHYVPENTMDAGAQWRRATTSVVFAIKIQPNGIGADAPYVTYKNKPYTIESFKEKIDKYESMSDEEKQAADVDAKLEMPAGFAKAIVDNGGAAELKAKLEANQPAFSVSEIRYYPTQINYYAMPIRHFTDEQSKLTLGYGRFGVVRNNIYKLTVSSIKNFGEPVVPTPGDEEDETEKEYFSVMVTVNPWLVRESNYDL